MTTLDPQDEMKINGNVRPLDFNAQKKRDLQDARADLAKRQAQTAEMLDAVTANVELLINTVAETIMMQMQLAEMDMKSGEPNRIILAEEAFARMEKAMPQNWTDIANQLLRQGFMCLRRALVQPTTF